MTLPTFWRSVLSDAVMDEINKAALERTS
jgi:hypothetical protein